MAKAMKATGSGMSSRTVSRADVRSATIHGYRAMKDNPRSVKITKGQREHIEKRSTPSK